LKQHGNRQANNTPHIAIQERLDGKSADWVEQVGDEQYQAGLRAE
jgi:hypothetical protein